MSLDDARAFVKLYAATDVSPTLTDVELDGVLAQCRVVDAESRRPSDPLYTPTIWATRAVMLAYDVKIAKVTAKTDLVADGTSIMASQVTANLRAQRRTWRAAMLPGSA